MLGNRNVWLIFLLAALIRIVFIMAVEHAPLENDARDYDTIGYNLSQGKGYINNEGKPSAYRPPIYPLFLGAVYSIAGHNLMAVRLLQAVLGAFICIFLYRIAKIIFDEKTAKLSGFLCCFYLPLIENTAQLMTETLFTLLIMSGLLLTITKKNRFNLFLSGLMFGLSLLTRPFIIFFSPFLLFWTMQNSKIEKIKSVTMLCAGILIVLLPWTCRNYIELKSFVPLTNGAGMALYNSYIIPSKGMGFNSLEGIGEAYHKIDNETERNKYLLRKTLEYMIQNISQVVKLAAIKLLVFIYPFDGYWYRISFGSKFNIFWGGALSFSIFGIIFGLKDNNALKLFHFLFISFLLGSVVFYGSPRFRFPIEPLLLCFAVSGARQLYMRKRHVFMLITSLNGIAFFIFRYADMRFLFDYFKNISC